MEAIKTIEDLKWAQENRPGLVEQCFSQVTVMKDLEEYLYWLTLSATPTTVVTKLNRWKNRSLGIHPSSACKKSGCLLKLYFECTGEVKPARPYNQQMQQIWDIGTLLHDTMQTHFENMYGDQFRREVPLKDEKLHIRSHTDGIFDFSLVSFILEMKSIKEGGNYGWEKVQLKPFEDNVRQGMFYMYTANRPFGLVFYMNKNAGLFKEHAFMWDQALWDEMKERFMPVVDAAFNDGTKVEASPGWHCRDCDYYHGCKPGKDYKRHAKTSTRRWRPGK